MKRVGIYVRVSTQEQKNHGLSVDNQLDALKKYCDEKGLYIASVYNDAGISARKSYKKRPALLQMLSDCQAHKIDLLIFTKLDRFFRSVPDYYACVEQMAGVPWRAIWEDYETETSAGVFKVNIMLSIAQAEADRTSDRVKAVNEYMKSQGLRMSPNAPLGYKVVKGKLCFDEEQKEAVTAFFKEYLNTFDILHTHKLMISLGYHIHRRTAERMLTNPTYYGDAHGIPCEGYITKEQYDMIQAKMSVRQRHTEQQVEYIFNGGLLRCGKCGRHMTGHSRKVISKDGTVNRYKWYRCCGARTYSCDMKASISELSLEKYLLNTIDDYISAYNSTLTSKAHKVVDIDKKRKNLQDKLERIGIRYEEGDISTEEYKAKRDAIKNEIYNLYMLNDSRDTEIILPENWKEIYVQLDILHKRGYWNRLIKEIIFTKDNPQIVL